jgi:lysophospholipase L1-like esterase
VRDSSSRLARLRGPVLVAVSTAVSATLLVSCGSAPSATSGTLGGVGSIPGDDLLSEVTLPPELANVDFPELTGPVLGTVAKGNRILMIGDSIMASTSSRYGGAMCAAVVPAGWRVAVEAEQGRFVEFGRRVLQARLADGWDAAVVFLGTNYTGGQQRYAERLAAIVDDLAPRPTLLVTTSLFRAKQAEVNAAIREVAAARSHVTVLDWTTISAQSGVLSGDRIHPSSSGVAILARAIGRAIGTAPASPGSCLKSQFTDDSSGDSSITPTTTTTTTTVAPAPESTTGSTPESPPVP